MKNIKVNSKLIKKNDIFLCIHDKVLDRHTFIKDIKDASLIITDKDVDTTIPYIKVNNTNDTYYNLLNRYYNHPFNKLKLIGITGTDGKTTTSEITYNLLNNFYDTSYLGTNGLYYKDKKISTKNTTPSLEELFNIGDILNKENINYLVMETSSEGLLHNRCYNLSFYRSALTNITSDHLNVHKNFNNYLNAKSKLFIQTKGISILNIDDKTYKKIKKHCNTYITYGTKKSDYRISNIKCYDTFTTFSIKYKNKLYNIKSPYLGIFNVYNLTCSIAIVNSIVNDIDKVIDKIKYLKQVEGRMNFLNFNQDYKIVLDYAHTTNATYQILSYINKIKKGRIITVVGCAGGRDKTKRKDIGSIISKYSDIAIFTKDDPRYENINNIFNDMTKNITKDNYLLIKNRKKAIYKALSIAKKDDFVLILGKGKDNYMAIKNKYKKYNDYKVIKKYFRKKKLHL